MDNIKRNSIICSFIKIVALIMWLFVPQYEAYVHGWMFSYDMDYSTISLLDEGLYSPGDLIIIVSIIAFVGCTAASCYFLITGKNMKLGKNIGIALPVVSIVNILSVLSELIDLVRDGNLELKFLSLLVIIITVLSAVLPFALIKEET